MREGENSLLSVSIGSNLRAKKENWLADGNRWTQIRNENVMLSQLIGLCADGLGALGGLFDERRDRAWLRDINSVAAFDLDDCRTRAL